MASLHAQARDRLEQARETVRRRKAEAADWSRKVMAAVAAGATESIERHQRGYERARSALQAAQSHEDGLLRRYMEFLVDEPVVGRGEKRSDNPLPLTGQYRRDAATGTKYKRTEVGTESGVQRFDVPEAVAERYLANSKQWRAKWKKADAELTKLRAKALADKAGKAGKGSASKARSAKAGSAKAKAKGESSSRARSVKASKEAPSNGAPPSSATKAQGTSARAKKSPAKLAKSHIASDREVTARLYARKSRRTGGVTINAKWKGEVKKLWLDVDVSHVGGLVVHPQLGRLDASGTRATVGPLFQVSVGSTGQTLRRKFSTVAAAKAAIRAADTSEGAPDWSRQPKAVGWNKVFEGHGTSAKAAKKKAPAKKAPAKKAAAKKVPAKKVPANKVPANKVPANKVPANKVAASRWHRDPESVAGDDARAAKAMEQLEILLSKPGILEQAEELGRARLKKKASS